MTETRTLLTPDVAGGLDLGESSGPLEFWKRVLPLGSIQYPAADGTSRKVTFDRAYHQSLIDSWREGAMDQVSFQLADAANTHTWDPEKHRGEVAELAHGDQIGRDAGLWARIRFGSAEDAAAVAKNPRLGVSASIRENVTRVDGKSFRAVLGHVLGTLNPRVTGLGPWEAVNLSDEDTQNLIDLTTESFQEAASMADDPQAPASTDGDSLSSPVVELTTEEAEIALAELLADDTDDNESGAAVPTQTELSTPDAGASLELAEQNALDLRVLRAELAESRWETERGKLAAAGVPKAFLDLATPVLSRDGSRTLELSNTDGGSETVDAAAVIRSLLEAAKGTIDLTNPEGYAEDSAADAGLNDAVTAWAAAASFDKSGI
jgi:hypothetical protein